MLGYNEEKERRSRLNPTHPGVPLLQVSFWELVRNSEPIAMAVMAILVAFSLLSWTIILGKSSLFRRARRANREFLRAFRKAPRLDTLAAASEQFRHAPLVAVFDFGYSEVSRQIISRGAVTNKQAVERTLQLGVSEGMAKLERSMNWLATTATVTPFIGLFGTVWGIIDAFQALGLAGAVSMRTVAPGIANALVATAMGLAAAIPAAIFYNHFGHTLKEMYARMEDFALEFLNLAERHFEG